MSRSTVLLDTHVLVWLIVSPERVPAETLDHLADAETRILVSAASAWEVATKHRLGKMPEASALLENWENDIATLFVEEIPITRDDALRGGSLDWSHRDPFDRVLAAQAMARNIPLVTGDLAMSTLAGLETLW